MSYFGNLPGTLKSASLNPYVNGLLWQVTKYCTYCKPTSSFNSQKTYFDDDLIAFGPTFASFEVKLQY